MGGVVAALAVGALGLGLFPTAIFVNDSSRQGDRFTQRTGCDRTGDGSAERPFGSLGRALRQVEAGQTIWMDAGVYRAKQGWVLAVDGLRVVGVPGGGTRLRVEEGSVLRAEGRRGLRLEDVVVEGGRIGIEWVGVRDSVMDRVIAVGAGTYGILLRDCAGIHLVGSMTTRSRFRGLQLDRAVGVVVEAHRSLENGNGGVVLRNARGNVLRGVRSDGNGMSGFFLSNGSRENQFFECEARDNRFVGFYLLGGSGGNVFRGGKSEGNERGVTASASPGNRFERMTVVGNRTSGFLFKEGSPENVLIRCRAEGNPEGDLVAAADSSPRLGFRNRFGQRVVLGR